MIAVIGTRNHKDPGQDKVSKYEQEYPEAVAFAREILPPLIQDYELRTGAAEGVDQRAANLWLSKGGEVRLYLPWASYEKAWVDSIKKKHLDNLIIEVYDKGLTAWTESVDKYHPNPNALKDSMRSLHARNYGIVSGCEFVLAFPSPDRYGGWGGTGQGMRIADGEGIPCFNCTEEEGRKKFLEFWEELQKDNPEF